MNVTEPLINPISFPSAIVKEFMITKNLKPCHESQITVC